MNNLLNETFNKHLSLLHKKLNLNEVTEQEISKIQSLIDNNQFLKGKIVTEIDLIETPKFILYVSEDSLNHIKERHKEETKPGSIFTVVNLRLELEKLLNQNPTEDMNGRVKWLGINTGNVIGKMGVKLGNPEEVEKMEDYQMPDGRKEMVKISSGERDDTNEMSLITSELGQLDDGKRVLSLITAFPGGTMVDGMEIPLDRGQFASKGLYFVVKKSELVQEPELNESTEQSINDVIDEYMDREYSGYGRIVKNDLIKWLDNFDITVNDEVIKILDGVMTSKGFIPPQNAEKHNLPSKNEDGDEVYNKESDEQNESKNTLNESFTRHLGYLRKKLIKESITDDWFTEGSFSTYKKPSVEHYEIATEDGKLKTLEGEQEYKTGYYILTGPKGEKYSMPPEKFRELKDDLGNNKCSPKKIMKVIKLADHDGSVQTSWGAKLDYTSGNDYIVKHGSNDYGVVKKDIFDMTYVKL